MRRIVTSALMSAALAVAAVTVPATPAGARDGGGVISCPPPDTLQAGGGSGPKC
ncbi:hypothetical protein Val02_01850 [Virgisporangium aliadipatigenens]|uniref:Uncharacterized protein n=1 Tax=Virgisporangium aliadipatigenens TaxID=741659 RepID=A0A8J4DME6_9ACTN|nr:hypothetical protein [Virgisporangium aliadipatigenens]GIJ43299.1 hypothetical protein Val02_01850 [Virgisporangium aliadipatigenens]